MSCDVHRERSNTGYETEQSFANLYEFCGLGELSRKGIQQLEWHAHFHMNVPELRLVFKRMLAFYSWRQHRGVNHLWSLPEIPHLDDDEIDHSTKQKSQSSPSSSPSSPTSVIILNEPAETAFIDRDSGYSSFSREHSSPGSATESMDRPALHVINALESPASPEDEGRRSHFSSHSDDYKSEPSESQQPIGSRSSSPAAKTSILPANASPIACDTTPHLNAINEQSMSPNCSLVIDEDAQQESGSNVDNVQGKSKLQKSSSTAPTEKAIEGLRKDELDLSPVVASPVAAVEDPAARSAGISVHSPSALAATSPDSAAIAAGSVTKTDYTGGESDAPDNTGAVQLIADDCLVLSDAAPATVEHDKESTGSADGCVANDAAAYSTVIDGEKEETPDQISRPAPIDAAVSMTEGKVLGDPTLPKPAAATGEERAVNNGSEGPPRKKARTSTHSLKLASSTGGSRSSADATSSQNRRAAITHATKSSSQVSQPSNSPAPHSSSSSSKQQKQLKDIVREGQSPLQTRPLHDKQKTPTRNLNKPLLPPQTSAQRIQPDTYPNSTPQRFFFQTPPRFSMGYQPSSDRNYRHGPLGNCAPQSLFDISAGFVNPGGNAQFYGSPGLSLQHMVVNDPPQYALNGPRCAFACPNPFHPTEYCTLYRTVPIRDDRRCYLGMCIHCLGPHSSIECRMPMMQRWCPCCGEHQTHVAFCPKLQW